MKAWIVLDCKVKDYSTNTLKNFFNFVCKSEKFKQWDDLYL
jgi:hypothetical protein